MARILIDGRFIGVGESISRYTLEILSGVLKLDKENDYTLLVRPQGAKEVKQFFGLTSDVGRQMTSSDFQLKILDIPHYSLSEQTKLLQYLSKENFDLVHFTQFNHPVRYKNKYIVTIHDLTMFGHLHRQRNPIKRLAFSQVMKSAVRDSNLIISVSGTTKKEVVQYYDVIPEKITVTHLGVDEKYSDKIENRESRIEEFKRKHKIENDYILYTGMWKRHKNILRMLKAFEKYLNDKTNSNPQCPKTQLVLIGKIDLREPEVLKEIDRINSIKKNFQPIITTGFIKEEDLPIAYAGALAYIMPSLSEGFGLPPLEAMACGTPVISSKESCMPEILGDAAYYFDAYNVDYIAKAIAKITGNKELRAELSKKGLEHAKKYSWDKTAKKTLEVYKKALEISR